MWTIVGLLPAQQQLCKYSGSFFFKQKLCLLFGELSFGFYGRVALGFVYKLFIWDLGAWPLYRNLPSLWVAVKRSPVFQMAC